VAAGERHDGYFEPDGVAWRVGRETALLLGGGRALLLQVAHPLVAAGVAAHSDYRENPWRRLEQTMSTVWSVVYGTRGEADAAVARVRAVHERVRGRIAEPMGPFRAGTFYSALDPELLLWVHATLVDTALLVYRSWVGPLAEAEQRAYYEEMKTMAVLFGTPEDLIPVTLDTFRDYMRERLASNEISITEAARKIAATVLAPPLPLPLRPAMRALALVTVGMLPARLRAGYGFPWGRGRAALVGVSRRSIRHVVMPLLPDIVRAVGASRRAEGRRGIDLDLGAILPSR
jgi:uncharacterized protein (DUF2236 family)